MSEPCPLGVLMSLRFNGACKLVRWNAAAGVYRCGALERGNGGGQWARLRTMLVSRWIAAGAGCDCELEVSAQIANSEIHPNDR